VELLEVNSDFVVCIKPVGLDSEQELPNALREQVGGEIFTLHRLDKNVGGVMVYARNKQAAARLSKVIADGEMTKEYMALVHGAPNPEGDWEDLLFKDSRKNKVFVVKRQRAGVKAARLAYRCLKVGEQSLVRIRLYTGRSHQIRVQFASRGFPLVGDHKYGSRDEATAPMLFSCCVTFPYQGQTRRFEAYPEWGSVE
jgi:23S rRNA pseudouridine1911/1915/1917 synthase